MFEKSNYTNNFWKNIGTAGSEIWKWFTGSNIVRSLTGSGMTDAQLQQSHMQMDFQQQMRDTQYQSAVQDMQKAGVNPALMYGSGASGNSAPSGANSTIQPTLDPVGLLGQIANLSLLKSQARLMNSEADKNTQDVKESEERINQIRANVSNLLANNDLIRVNIRRAITDNSIAEVALKYADKEHELGILVSGLSAQQIEQNIKESVAKVDKLSAEKQTEVQRLINMKQEYNNLVSQQNLTDEQCEQVRHLVKQIDATTNNIIANTNLTYQDISYYEWNHTKEIAPTKGHIDSKGNTVTFGSSKGVTKAKNTVKSKFDIFKKAVRSAYDLRY